MQQHVGDGACVKGEADLVREHVASADRNDAERRVGAEKGRCHLANGAVTAGRNNRIVTPARHCLTRRMACSIGVSGARAREGGASRPERVRYSSTRGDPLRPAPGLAMTKKLRRMASPVGTPAKSVNSRLRASWLGCASHRCGRDANSSYG